MLLICLYQLVVHFSGFRLNGWSYVMDLIFYVILFYFIKAIRKKKQINSWSTRLGQARPNLTGVATYQVSKLGLGWIGVWRLFGRYYAEFW